MGMAQKNSSINVALLKRLINGEMVPVIIAADPMYCKGSWGSVAIFTLDEAKSVKIDKKIDIKLQNTANLGEVKTEGVDSKMSAIGIVGILDLCNKTLPNLHDENS